ncbi:PTS sugar transporter subunit IIA [Bacillus sp. FJAT-29790]|uniref:PTS sugar transporter subunit IIA n=1 Tax=Bacillus sp. FJAT-29790 TaxID=1895002 RepID=UPI0020B401EC|nr:PTS sugar transporter subunit IIA [Bacillus sp. FJAT-29790]
MYFDETLILRDIEGESNEDILKIMASNLFEQGIVKESYIDAIIEREKNYATGLPTMGMSVAIPHTDIEHVNKKAISVGILKNTVDFGIMGDDSETTPVKLVFMLAMDQSHSQLELLQRLMQIFQNVETLETIANEGSKTKIKDLLLNQLNPSLKGGE